MKKALRDTQTLRVRAGYSKVRTLPTRPLQTRKHPDRTDYNTLRRSSLSCSVIRPGALVSIDLPKK